MLEESNKFSSDQIESFAAPILEKLNIRLSVDKGPELRLIFSDKEIERTMLKSLLLSQREIVLATRTHVGYLIQEAMTRAVSGVTLRIIADKDLELYLGKNIEKVFFDDCVASAKPSTLRYVSLRENVTIRKTKVPFDMLLIDDKILIIGLIDRRDVQKYNAGIVIED